MVRAHIDVPSLVGGISQQPPALRLSNQAESVVNAWLSPVDGLTPRGHTKHRGKLYSGKPGFNHWHPIHRDRREQYMLRYGHLGVEAYDLQGASLPVRWDTRNLVETPSMVSSPWTRDAGVAVLGGEENPMGGSSLVPEYEQNATLFTSTASGDKTTTTVVAEDAVGTKKPIFEDRKYLWGLWVKNFVGNECELTTMELVDDNANESTSLALDWTATPLPTATITKSGSKDFNVAGVEQRSDGWFIIWVAVQFNRTGGANGLTLNFTPHTGLAGTKKLHVWHCMLEEYNEDTGRPSHVWAPEISTGTPAWETVTPYLNFMEPLNIVGDVERSIGDAGFPINGTLSWMLGTGANTPTASTFPGPFATNTASRSPYYYKLLETALNPTFASWQIDRGVIGAGFQLAGVYSRFEDSTATEIRLNLRDETSGTPARADFTWALVNGVRTLQAIPGSSVGPVRDFGVIQSPDDAGDFFAWILVHPDDDVAYVPGNARRLYLYVNEDGGAGGKFIYAHSPVLLEDVEIPDFFAHMGSIRRANSITVNDYTFMVNPGRTIQRYHTRARVSGTDESRPTPVPLKTPDDPTGQRAYFFLKIGGPDQEYVTRVYYTDGTFDEVFATSWDGSAARTKCVGGSGDTSPECVANGGTWQLATADHLTIETNEIAGFIAADLNALTDLTASHKGSVIEIQIDAASAKTIDYVETDDSQGGLAYFPIHRDIENLDDLPKVCRDGWRMKIRGSSDEDSATYVTFKTDRAGFGQIGEGEWVESSYWESEDMLDPHSMPLQVIRRQDTELGFYTGVGNSVFFEVGPMIPNRRLVGDDDTNPFPSFTSRDGIPRSATDVFFFEGRLGILSDESMVLSEVNRFFNFFRTTGFDLIDSDPVLASASHTEVAKLNDAFVMDERLLLTSDRNQFVAEGDPILTPKTVSLTPKMSQQTERDVPLVASGRGAFMVFPKQGLKDGPVEYSGVREVRPVQTSGLEFQAEDISDAVPSLIAGRVREQASSTNLDLLVVVTENGKLFPFKFLTRAQQDLQQAWSEWTFGGARVKHASFFQSEMVVILDRDDGVYLETALIGDGLLDEGLPFRARMDRRVDDTVLSSSYDAGNDETTFTLPYEATTGSTVLCVDRVTGKDYQVLSASGTSVVVQGDRTGDLVFLGESYEMLFQFTEPVPRARGADGTNRRLSSGRALVLGGKVVFADSSKFFVDVAHEFGETYTQEFNAVAIGTGLASIDDVTLDTGEFQFDVGAYPEEVTVTLRTDSYLPCQILSALWEINRMPGSTQLQG